MAPVTAPPGPHPAPVMSSTRQSQEDEESRTFLSPTDTAHSSWSSQRSVRDDGREPELFTIRVNPSLLLRMVLTGLLTYECVFRERTYSEWVPFRTPNGMFNRRPKELVPFLIFIAAWQGTGLLLTTLGEIYGLLARLNPKGRSCSCYFSLGGQQISCVFGPDSESGRRAMKYYLPSLLWAADCLVTASFLVFCLWDPRKNVSGLLWIEFGLMVFIDVIMPFDVTNDVVFRKPFLLLPSRDQGPLRLD